MKVTTRIKDRVDGSLPERERAQAAADAAQLRAEELRARADEFAANARLQAGHAKVRAEELAAVTRERAAEAGEQAREKAGDMAENVGPLVARVLAFLAALFGGLTERGREVAARVDPPAGVRRQRRLRTAGWFAGGFLAGAATGWVLHARMRSEPQDPDFLYGEGSDLGEQSGASPYGHEAEAIDARRENAPFS